MKTFATSRISLSCLLWLASFVLAPALAHAQAGKEGVKNIYSGTVTLNGYAALTADAAAGSSMLQTGAFSGPDALTPGDLVLVIQMQGAAINLNAATQAYGAVINYNNTGFYELAEVSAVNGSGLQLANPLTHTYNTTGNARSQAVKVPRFTALNLHAGAAIVPERWNGSTGGIVALEVSGTATLDGRIDVSGAGFRGGAIQQLSNAVTPVYYSDYAYADPAKGAAKGEGIAGSTTFTDNNNGSLTVTGSLPGGAIFGRGAAANGGGGGNSHNAGGGGGANAAATGTWNGQGQMCTSCPGAEAWQLDPAYLKYNGLAASSGGGRGGYTFSLYDANALTTGPDLTNAPHNGTAWGGDNRKERGGLGGRPLAVNAANRVFMGGGGGSGDSNNGHYAGGANGGGLVFLEVGLVTGSGSVEANGTSARTSYVVDAPGGGGAGGTILIRAGLVNGVTLKANGGNGGNQEINGRTPEAEGPGGGGSGGYIYYPGGSAATSVLGGANGTSDSAGITEFIANGATSGAAGLIQMGSLPGGMTPLPVSLLHFSAQASPENVTLNWETTSEKNNAYFAVERSADGLRFTALGKVNGSGTSNTLVAYRFRDSQPLSGRSYYRLRQVDYDGTETFSPVVTVRLEHTIAALSVYPNPATAAATLMLTTSQAGPATIRITDLTGAVKQITSLHLESGTLAIPISLAALPAGTYFVTLEAPGFRQTQRLVKQ